MLSEFNFRIDMRKSKLLGISSLAKETKLSRVLLTSLYQEKEIQPQDWAALLYGNIFLRSEAIDHLHERLSAGEQKVLFLPSPQ